MVHNTRKTYKPRKTYKQSIDDLSNDIELTYEEQQEIMIIKMTEEQQIQFCQQEIELMMAKMTEEQQRQISQEEKECMLGMLLKSIQT